MQGRRQLPPKDAPAAAAAAHAAVPSTAGDEGLPPVVGIDAMAQSQTDDPHDSYQPLITRIDDILADIGQRFSKCFAEGDLKASVFEQVWGFLQHTQKQTFSSEAKLIEAFQTVKEVIPSTIAAFCTKTESDLSDFADRKQKMLEAIVNTYCELARLQFLLKELQRVHPEKENFDFRLAAEKIDSVIAWVPEELSKAEQKFNDAAEKLAMAVEATKKTAGVVTQVQEKYAAAADEVETFSQRKEDLLASVTTSNREFVRRKLQHNEEMARFKAQIALLLDEIKRRKKALGAVETKQSDAVEVLNTFPAFDVSSYQLKQQDVDATLDSLRVRTSSVQQDWSADASQLAQDIASWKVSFKVDAASVTPTKTSLAAALQTYQAAGEAYQVALNDRKKALHPDSMIPFPTAVTIANCFSAVGHIQATRLDLIKKELKGACYAQSWGKKWNQAAEEINSNLTSIDAEIRKKYDELSGLSILATKGSGSTAAQEIINYKGVDGKLAKANRKFDETQQAFSQQFTALNDEAQRELQKLKACTEALQAPATMQKEVHGIGSGFTLDDKEVKAQFSQQLKDIKDLEKANQSNVELLNDLNKEVEKYNAELAKKTEQAKRKREEQAATERLALEEDRRQKDQQVIWIENYHFHSDAILSRLAEYEDMSRDQKSKYKLVHSQFERVKKELNKAETDFAACKYQEALRKASNAYAEVEAAMLACRAIHAKLLDEQQEAARQAAAIAAAAATQLPTTPPDTMPPVRKMSAVSASAPVATITIQQRRASDASADSARSGSAESAEPTRQRRESNVSSASDSSDERIVFIQHETPQAEPEKEKPGFLREAGAFLKRNWWKILLAGVLIAGVVVAGVFTFGAAPAVAGGIMAATGVGATVATALGMTGIAVGGFAVGAAGAAVGAKIAETCDPRLVDGEEPPSAPTTAPVRSQAAATTTSSSSTTGAVTAALQTAQPTQPIAVQTAVVVESAAGVGVSTPPIAASVHSFHAAKPAINVAAILKEIQDVRVWMNSQKESDAHLAAQTIIKLHRLEKNWRGLTGSQTEPSYDGYAEDNAFYQSCHARFAAAQADVAERLSVLIQTF